MSNEEKNQFMRDSIPLDYAQLGAMVIKDLNDSSAGSALAKRYSKADIERFMGNPQRYDKELAGMSEYLYQYSPHYRRLINYYVNMPTLDYIIEPYGLDATKINANTFQKGYQRAMEFTDLLNVKHEYRKALKKAWIRDTFYGYQHVAKDSYFIQELPYTHCRISSIEDGVYNFSMDMQYFDRNPIQLEMYPKEFKKLYNSFKAGKGQWQELDSSNTVVIKINDDVTYDLPPFVGVFRSIFDIEDYKALKLTRETISNYKFVVQKIPIRDNSDRNNDFLIDLNHVAMFHNKTSQTLPEEIGLISTPFEVDTINFAKDRSESDNVMESEREFYSSAGSSSQLFNGDKSSNANLGKSINVDEQEVFAVNRQVERFINRKMKWEVKGTYKFRMRILDTTVFNRKETIESYLQSAQYGLPVKMLLSASLGLSPSAVVNMSYLENEILNLTEKFIPLSSSHTQSGDATDEGGRPESNDDELSDKGEEQRDRGDNDNRE